MCESLTQVPTPENGTVMHFVLYPPLFTYKKHFFCFGKNTDKTLSLIWVFSTCCAVKSIWLKKQKNTKLWNINNLRTSKKGREMSKFPHLLSEKMEENQINFWYLESRTFANNGEKLNHVPIDFIRFNFNINHLLFQSTVIHWRNIKGINSREESLKCYQENISSVHKYSLRNSVRALWVFNFQWQNAFLDWIGIQKALLY